MPRRRDDDETRAFEPYDGPPYDIADAFDPELSPEPPPDEAIQRFVEEYEIITTIRPRGAGAGSLPAAPVASRELPAILPQAILPPPPPPRVLAPPAVPHPDPIPGIIPAGSICTLSGASGVGKTALIAGCYDASVDHRGATMTSRTP